MKISKTKIVNALRECKAYAFGYRALLLKAFEKNKRIDPERGVVLLLSMGGRFGSPMLASRLKKKGFNIHVVSKKMPGYELAYADKWWKASCVDDFEKLLEIANEIGPDFVMSEMRNILLPTKAKLIEELGILSFGQKSAIASTSKGKLREFVDEQGLDNVQWTWLKNYKQGDFNFPVILKPDLGTGSRGVKYIADEAELQEALQLEEMFVKDDYVGGEMLIEEFAPGRLFDVSGVSFNGEHYPLCITEMTFTPVDGAVPCSWYLFSPPVVSEFRKRILETSKSIVSAMGVVNGGWTCETRLTADDRLVPIDFANRPAYPKMVTTASGEDFLDWYISSMTGAKERPNPKLGSLYQRYIYDSDEHAKWISLEKAHPNSVVEFRKLNNNYSTVELEGKVAVKADNFNDLAKLLNEFGLLPEEWSDLYSELPASSAIYVNG